MEARISAGPGRGVHEFLHCLFSPAGGRPARRLPAEGRRADVRSRREACRFPETPVPENLRRRTRQASSPMIGCGRAALTSWPAPAAPTTNRENAAVPPPQQIPLPTRRRPLLARRSLLIKSVIKNKSEGRAAGFGPDFRVG